MRIDPKTIVKTYIQNNHNAKKTAQILGIHRSTVYRWVKRAKSPVGYNVVLRYQNLTRRTTRPNRIRRKLTSQQIYDIVSLRSKRGYDVRKIKHILGLNASKSTIYRILKKKGLIEDNPRYTRPRFQNTTHMHAKNVKTIGFLQMDVKHITPQLSGLPWTCYEYAVIDIFSRYKEAEILNQLDSDGAVLSLMNILSRLPFKPTFIQTDNGLEFQGKFKEFVDQIGLKHHFIHKKSPNENAVIERSFRTDNDEFFYRLEKAPQHYDELREWFAQFLHEYNNIRPHFGIELRTPAEVVANVMGH